MANKRVVDGPGIWQSNKLKQVQPVAFRAEFANLLPLATGNGTFECHPDLILHQVYGFNRPDMTLELLTQLLNEFERVKLLFRWKVEDSGVEKIYGYWIGIDKPGRLPPESRRKHEVMGAEVPKRLLDDFIKGKIMASHWLTNGCIGFGSGSCIGSGEGEGGAAAPESQPQPQNQNPSPSLSCTDTDSGQVEADLLWIEEQAADPPGSSDPIAIWTPQLRELVRADLQGGRSKKQILSAIRITVGLDGYGTDKKPGLFIVQNYPAQLRVVAVKRPKEAQRTAEMIARIGERERQKAAAEAADRAREQAEAESLIEDELPTG